MANATEALTELRRALEAGGFREGARAYEQMADMLIWQRLWAESEAVEIANFDAVGALAADIWSLLEPYASAMRRLAAFRPTAEAVAETRSEDAAVMSVLRRRGGRGVTSATVARECGLPRDQTIALLEELVSRGSVEVRGSGGARLYRPARDSTARRPAVRTR